MCVIERDREREIATFSINVNGLICMISDFDNYSSFLITVGQLRDYVSVHKETGNKP